jgi:ATP-binding cassette subfamily B protein/subfamily B ATP-binding cassette protein MsbA
MGMIFTALFTIFNGFTFGSVIPVIDTLTPGQKTFQFNISENEKNLLERSQSGTSLSILDKFSLKLSKAKIWFNTNLRTKSKEKQILYVALGIIPLFFFRSLFSVLSIYIMRRIGLFMVRDIKSKVFSHLQKLSMEYYHGERTGHIMQRLTADMDILSRTVSEQFELLIRHVLTIIIFISAIIYISWQMSLFSLIILPIMIAPIAAFTDRLQRASRTQFKEASNLSAYLQEALSGVRVIRAFGKEKFEAEKFSKLAHQASITELKNHLYASLSPSLVELFSSIATAFLFYYGGLQIIGGQITTGEFLFFLLALLSLLTPIKQLARMTTFFHQADVVCERTFDILDRTPKIQNSLNPMTLDKVSKGIEFSEVTFRYENSAENVLNNINFFVPAGSTVALVGPSGGGKSTIIDMVARFYDPLSGIITIDDIDLRNLKIKSLRDRIAIVTQEIFLFSGSVKFNIAFGKEDPKDDEIILAAKAANAHNFIMELPNGYDTLIGERGVTLSGGQRQRLSIARAILCNPDILLLDEATSALDTESERLVQEALNHLLHGRTSLVVAHRLSTIKEANIIFVIEKGMIIETGNHEGLLKNNGLYKKLYDMQFNL